MPLKFLEIGGLYRMKAEIRFFNNTTTYKSTIMPKNAVVLCIGKSLNPMTKHHIYEFFANDMKFAREIGSYAVGKWFEEVTENGA